MRNGEPQIYTALATLRNGQAQMSWSKIQLFLAFNTIAAPLVLGAGQPDSLKLIISVAALVVHFAIIISALRGDYWQRYWEERMAELEELAAADQSDAGSRVRVFSHRDFRKVRYSGLASRKLFGPICIFVTAGWLEESIRHAYNLNT